MGHEQGMYFWINSNKRIWKVYQGEKKVWEDSTEGKTLTLFLTNEVQPLAPQIFPKTLPGVFPKHTAPNNSREQLQHS